MVGGERLETITLPIEELVFDEETDDEEFVARLTDSISSSIMINSVTVIARKREDGRTEYPVICGGKRAIAQKRSGKTTIRCTLVNSEDPLLLEQLSIDENLMRKKLSTAETSMSWGRRTEIKKKKAERDGTLSQNATASMQVMRAAGQETGHDVGSVRDQAQQTGESKDKIHRSVKRYNDLGPAVLKSIVGTSLDAGVELDALAQLPEQVRAELVQRATAGEEVSAKDELRKAQRAPRPTKSTVLDVEHALRDFERWQNTYKALWEAKGWSEKIDSIGYALRDIVEGIDERDDPEDAGWFYRWRNRKRD